MAEQKKALQLASVASMIDQFNIPNIQILLDLGYKVDVVADFTHPGTITNDRAEDLKSRLNDMGVRVIDIAIPRSLNPSAVMSAYKQVKKLITSEHYDLIHCHSPIGGVICRQAAKSERKNGTKVIYTAHGFHFYDGAPLKNWMIFYPIEKYFSRCTDVLITINKEDYKRASEKFKARKVVYIPGVGVDTEKFAVCKVDKRTKRSELGVKDSDFILLSVGELSERKNQKVIIDALHMIKEEGNIDDIVYLAVGKGDQEEEFRRLIREYGLDDHIKLLGFRADIDELCEIVDCFVHPSIREGLGIASLEAMAAGLPLISANVNGIKDYTEDGVSGYCIDPTNVDAMVKAIKHMYDDETFRNNCASNNFKTAKTFDIRHTDEIMSDVYRGGYRHLLSIAVRQEKREELGLGLSDFVVISIGELNDNKNHRVIIEALADVPDAKYVIVGKGNLEEQLRKLAVEHGVSNRVILTGFRTDVRDLLWMSDCFAFPSKREGLGIAALEGMSAGLPVIGHGIGGIRNFVIDGETGWLCGDDNDYKQKLRFTKEEGDLFRMSLLCKRKAEHFSVSTSNRIMKKEY
jgi:glycosyltransferase involved in cell wall biosynthesis